MKWILRLVEIEGDGPPRSADVLEIRRPDGSGRFCAILPLV